MKKQLKLANWHSQGQFFSVHHDICHGHFVIQIKNPDRGGGVNCQGSFNAVIAHKTEQDNHYRSFRYRQYDQ